MADATFDHLTVTSISAPPGQSLRVLMAGGFIEVGFNGIRIVSLVPDPPEICLEAAEGGSLGKISYARHRADGGREEVVLHQGKIDERNRDGLGGECTTHLRRDGVHDGDKAMERVEQLSFNVDGPLVGSVPPVPPTEPPPTQPPPTEGAVHGIAPGDFAMIRQVYHFSSEDEAPYREGRMTWADVIGRMDQRDNYEHFPPGTP